ncbi:TPA: fimbrial protein, partial [Proteus mirabilis]|nr:fimbrial protein [Proteus mirabilis]
MFKKYLLAISLLALSSGTTLAANPIAKLKVTGRIKPPTCTINNEEQEAT